MLSQLNLRFHKKQIEALKAHAGRENTSVNAIAERFLDDGLKTAAAGDGYFQLIADPEITVRQLYRHIMLGQTFGAAPVTQDELHFMLLHARNPQALAQGHHGERVMFSPQGRVSPEGFFRIDGLRIFLQAEALIGLRGLYGDL